MKITEGDILAYYLGDANAEQAAAVEQALQDDPSLTTLAANCRKVAAGFRQLQKDDLYEQALRFEGILAEGQQKRNRRKGWLGLLAGLAVMLVAYAGLRASYKQQSVAKRFFVLPTASYAGTEETRYTDGLYAFYVAKDYRAANRDFQQLLGSSTYDISARFYLAHGKFMVDSVSVARVYFTTLLEEEGRFDQEEYASLKWNYWVTGFLLGEETLATAPEYPARDSLLAPTQSVWYDWFN